ncbi:MAG: DNA repair protein RecO [Saprospiraceae bacterium]|nr:DNA repair protein RecO [Saprospiraceae bacterium]
MMLHTRGIVFRTVKYGETSVIADIYTEKKGLQTFIAGGVRKAKAKISPSLLQVMSLVDLVSYFREQKEMHRLKEIKSGYWFQEISRDVIKSSVGLFMLEIAQKSIKEAEENLPLFNFLWNSLVFVDENRGSLANIPLSFMMNLSAYLGFFPGGTTPEDSTIFDLQEGHFTDQSPGHTYYLSEDETKAWWSLMQFDFDQCQSISISRETRKDLLRQMILYYRLHIENFKEPQSHRIFESVFH